MQETEYWSILERDHRIQNPTTAEKLILVAEYCRVGDGSHVLDVGCGKGWLLRSMAEAWEIEGTGLEINPHFIAEAQRLSEEEGSDDRLTFVQGPALAFEPEESSYDLVLCIGASFALGSFSQALAWTRDAMRPGGYLAIGEPFMERPTGEGTDGDHTAWLSLAGTVAEIERHDLTLTGLITASTDDWDHYYSLRWRAVREWADENPEHPDRDEVLSRVGRERATYLERDRGSLGWGIFIARRSNEG